MENILINGFGLMNIKKSRWPLLLRLAAKTKMAAEETNREEMGYVIPRPKAGFCYRKLSPEECLDKYFGVYPSDLFECHDGTYGMHFIFSLKNTSFEESEELFNILRYCGADVSCKLEDATPYSAIIVDHNDKVGFKGPAFTINYIKDCLEKRKLLDLCSYRQLYAAEDIIVESSYCMSVVHFRHFGWKEAEGSEEDTNINSESSNEQESTNQEAVEMKVIGGKINLESSDEQESTIPKAEEVKVINKTPRLYSDMERYNILRYIAHHNQYARVKGRELWVVMERKKVCPGRTWQSMKEHFLKRIKQELNSYKFLTEEERTEFKRSF